MLRSFLPSVTSFLDEVASPIVEGPLSAVSRLQDHLGNDCMRQILLGGAAGGLVAGPVGAVVGAVIAARSCHGHDEEEGEETAGDGGEQQRQERLQQQQETVKPEETPAPDPTPAVDTAEAERILSRLGFGFADAAGNTPELQAMLDAFRSVYRLEESGGLGESTLELLRRAEAASISFDELVGIMPSLTEEEAELYLKYINGAMSEGEINTDARQAAFLAQLAHESGELLFMEELADGSDYEGRSDLGNTQPGDGRRYKGRGPIQLTGRSNYQQASAALGIDLVSNPERAAEPDVGFRIAAWFWSTRDLNTLADQGDFVGITERINGGTNGLSSRQAYYRTAQSVLGQH